MTTTTRGPSVPAIRYAARRAVARTSLRKVAAEMGMAVSWLNGFVDGKERTLRAKTMRMLREWYMRSGASLAELDSDTAISAVGMLTGGLLDDDVRKRVHESLVKTLADAYGAQGPVPGWIKAVQEAGPNDPRGSKEPAAADKES
ncbi:MAG TPA: hypothetical protein VF771_07875 [Longimicrobiaceae bacterium]